MPFNSETKTFSRVWRFVDQFRAGDDANRADFDTALGDIADGLQQAIDYLEEKIDTYLPGTGIDPATMTGETFSGDGNSVQFVLTVEPKDPNAAFVFIEGVFQQPDTYDLSGTVLTFSEAPPAGSDNIYVLSAQSITSIRSNASQVTTSRGMTVQGELDRAVWSFDTVADMLEDTVGYNVYAEGDRIEAGGLGFTVLAEDVEEYNVLKPGGVKLGIVNSPTVNAAAFGEIGENVADNSVIFNKAIEYCAAQGGGTVVAPCGIYPTQNYVHLLQGVKLAAYFPSFNTEGGAITFKMDAAHNEQAFGTGSVRAGLLFAGVKGVGCSAVSVDMEDAPDGAIGVLGAGFWYSDLNGIFVKGLGGASGTNHAQIGILFCTMNIGVFWNNHKYLRTTSNAGFAGTHFRVTSDKPYGGGAVSFSQPNQQTFSQCKVNGPGLIGFDFDGIGGGIACYNCQAENGSAAGTAVKVQGTNPDVKPIWVGGEINGYSTGFDGEIMTEEVLFAGATVEANGGTPFTNGAQYRFLGLQRVSKIGLTTPANRRRGRFEYDDLIIVPTGVATTLLDMADFSGNSAINAENILAFIIARASGNAARHYFAQVPIFSRFNTNVALGAFTPTEFGTSLGITLSVSGTLIQMTQTSGADVAVSITRMGGTYN